LIKKLMSNVGEYKRYIYFVPVFIFLDVLCELSMPLLMSRIVDVGIAGKDTSYIIKTGIEMTLLAVAAMIFGVLNMKFTSIVSQGFGANLRDTLFEKVQSFSFANIDKFSTASLVTRLTTDVNILQTTFMMIMRILLRGPLMLIIAFILAFNINARLSIILAIAIPSLVLCVWLIMSRAVRLYTVVQQKLDLLNRTIQENLIGIRVVKSFVREDFEKSKFKQSNDELTDSGIRAANLGILTMPVMIFVMNAATLAIIWFGGQMVYTKVLGPGELIGYMSYVFQILFSVMMISMVILMSARARASGDRVVEVLETEIDIVDDPNFRKALPPSGQPAATAVVSTEPAPVPKRGKVEFRKVCFKYSSSGSGENVLSDLNFTVESGKVVAVVGGTGAGKSSLVSLIPRLYDVSEGEVLVDDVDVRRYPLKNLRQEIGMVLQKNTLFSGTIRENLLWGNENASDEEIISACQDAQAYDFIQSFPQGFDTSLGQGGVNLSGGQKQRLCIARAIIKKPKILILDDSTSAVDSHTESKIRTAFYQSLSDTTVFIIAQRISSVREADLIIVLDDGKIVGMGTHQELMASNEVYQEINASQQEGVLNHE